ncbi:MAG TPA: DUF3467 domain-containing protein [Streptosporangiaceae bacterium]|jgi:hypothetical protein
MTDPVWATPSDPSDIAPRYANGVVVAMSQWDLTIEFQQRYPLPGKPVTDLEWPNRSIARIAMSPPHAKVLSELLSNAVNDYENRFGALPSTETLLQVSDSDTGVFKEEETVRKEEG